MSIKKYDKSDIQEAYIKLKSSIYYDKNLFYKNNIAVFEYNNNLEEKFQEILDILHSNNYKDKINKYLKLIDFFVMPKNIKKEIALNNSPIITNKSIKDEYVIEDVNFFINLPVELQIIDTLWCMTVGKRLQKKFNTDILYANILDLNKSRKFKSKNLFKKYFQQYSKWRDNAINEVEKLYSHKNKSSIIFSLDIKRYYYNIDINYTKLNQYKKNLILSNLTQIVELIHEKYRNKIKSYLNKEYRANNFLPIGLLSSGIIANWYLSDFDDLMLQSENLKYYGRYVDDILCVFEIDENVPDFKTDEDLLKIYFEKSNLFNFEDGNLNFSSKQYSNLRIQQSKIKAFIIDKLSSKHIIEKFKTDILANSSEFRFLPSVKGLDQEYYSKLFSLNYEGSSNILRNIDKFSINKYNIAVYLAKKIKMSFYIQKNYEEDFLLEALDKILKGEYLIELYNYWFKIFEYLLITKNSYRFKNFYKEVQNKCICRITYKNETIESKKSKIIQNKIRTHIQNFLKIAATFALALNPDKNFKFWYANENELINKIKYYRMSNLIDNNRIFIPLYNYSEQNKIETEKAIKLGDFRNLLKNNYKDLNKDLYKLDNNLLKLSPINIYDSKKELNKIFGNILFNDCKELSAYTDLKNKDRKIKIVQPNDEKRQINIYDVDFQDSTPNLSKIKIGIVNKLITENEAKELNNYDISDQSYENVRDLLEEAKIKKCHLLVFPELAIPIEFLPLLYEEVKSKQIGIITGLKHFTNSNNCIYNFLCTLLPFKYKGIYNDSFVTLRVKNNYSPIEKELILKSKYQIPDIEKRSYDLIHWKGLYFSSYNCFEISSVEDRTLFKGSVDFITIHAFNRDVEYFNNILKSTARDIHCCAILVNNSNFGYSAVALPKQKSYQTLPVIVKGSEDDLIMTYTYDYKNLRKFQNEYIKQSLDKQGEIDGEYKHLPPNFVLSNGRLY